MAMGTTWLSSKATLEVSIYCEINVTVSGRISLSCSGVREAFNPYAVLELCPAGDPVSAPGEVRIKGMETGLYVAMSTEGRLYAEPDPNNEATLFIEAAEGHKLTYLR